MKKRLKLNGVIIFIAVMLVIVFPPVFIRQNRFGAFETVLEIAGILLILLGQTIRVSARGYKSEYSERGLVLIQSGPYAIVRNPMYLGILLIGVGVILALFQWWVAAIFISIFAIRYIALIFKEEEKLVDIFHRTYQNYCRKVPRLFPKISSLWKTDIGAYLPLKAAWLYKEIGSMLALFAVMSILGAWADSRYQQWKFHLWTAGTAAVTVIFYLGFIFYVIRRTRKNETRVSNKSKNN